MKKIIPLLAGLELIAVGPTLVRAQSSKVLDEKIRSVLPALV